MEIKVKGMMCEHCEKKVEKKLIELGAANPKADHKSGIVSFDDINIDLKQLKKELSSIGFKLI